MSADDLRHRFAQLVANSLRASVPLPDGVERALDLLVSRVVSWVIFGGLRERVARALLSRVLANIHALDANEITQIAMSSGPSDLGSEVAPLDGSCDPSASHRVVKRAKRGGSKGLSSRSLQGSADPVSKLPEQATTVFSELTCPAVVVVKKEFELRVGLSADPNRNVVSEPFVLPPNLPDDFALTIQIVATGFAPRETESLRQVLRVTRKKPYPAVTIHLTPEDQSAKVKPRALQAIYSVGAQTIGMAVRALSVVKNPDLLETTAAPPAYENRDLAVPVGTNAPDMTVRLLRDRTRPGALTWSIETRFVEIEIPGSPMHSDIGTDPQMFARRVMSGVNARQSKPQQLERYLLGVAKSIATKHIPDDFWRIFGEVATRTGHPPTILLLSEEPYVPWELAFVDSPIDPEAPPFLAAQAVVGRWPLSGAKLPPPEELNVKTVAVVTGVYGKPGWQRLKAAEDEATTLVDHRFGSAIAKLVDAAPEPIVRCLGGDPTADLLHFAVHGIFDPNGTNDGIVLVDGSFLDPFEVRGATLKQRPFVFLNACQVGQGNAVLGDYAGMAEAFLYAGASAVIAPLWSIKDTLAKDAALDFYGAETTQPAHALRRARAAGADSTSTTLALRLAYQFFGHPTFKLHLPPKPLEVVR